MAAAAVAIRRARLPNPACAVTDTSPHVPSTARRTLAEVVWENMSEDQQKQALQQVVDDSTLDILSSAQNMKTVQLRGQPEKASESDPTARSSGDALPPVRLGAPGGTADSSSSGTVAPAATRPCAA